VQVRVRILACGYGFTKLISARILSVAIFKKHGQAALGSATAIAAAINEGEEHGSDRMCDFNKRWSLCDFNKMKRQSAKKWLSGCLTILCFRAIV
jgi:hypothetical protein